MNTLLQWLIEHHDDMTARLERTQSHQTRIRGGQEQDRIGTRGGHPGRAVVPVAGREKGGNFKLENLPLDVRVATDGEAGDLAVGDAVDDGSSEGGVEGLGRGHETEKNW